jgi:hypothetical protein
MMGRSAKAEALIDRIADVQSALRKFRPGSTNVPECR